jgi:hypothetical protein
LSEVKQTIALVGVICERRSQSGPLLSHGYFGRVRFGFLFELLQQLAGVAQEGFDVGPDLWLDGLAFHRL